jgi:endoglycosylceramidase
MPMLVGEWGAYYENPAAVAAAQFAVRQFDLVGCGDLYWDYTREMNKSPLLRALERHSREPAS